MNIQGFTIKTKNNEHCRNFEELPERVEAL